MISQKPIALAADHGGYLLKAAAMKHFDSLGIAYVDYGCNGPESVNYPDYAKKVCKAIQEEESDLGILFCGTGIGMSMVANKHRGIRAACCSDTFSAKLTRMHNNANILCMGGRVVGEGLALDMIDLFINTDFEGGRHALRLEMYKDIQGEK